ncbi:TetR family transcriptional regulator, partial [Streptomyces griseus]|nr:TetR family transcriptional regulator [Streptomyces griseus]
DLLGDPPPAPEQRLPPPGQLRDTAGTADTTSPTSPTEEAEGTEATP